MTVWLEKIFHSGSMTWRKWFRREKSWTRLRVCHVRELSRLICQFNFSPTTFGWRNRESFTFHAIRAMSQFQCSISARTTQKQSSTTFWTPSWAKSACSDHTESTDWTTGMFQTQTFSIWPTSPWRQTSTRPSARLRTSSVFSCLMQTDKSSRSTWDSTEWKVSLVLSEQMFSLLSSVAVVICFFSLPSQRRMQQQVVFGKDKPDCEAEDGNERFHSTW